MGVDRDGKMDFEILISPLKRVGRLSSRVLRCGMQGWLNAQSELAGRRPEIKVMRSAVEATSGVISGAAASAVSSHSEQSRPVNLTLAIGFCWTTRLQKFERA